MNPINWTPSSRDVEPPPVAVSPEGDRAFAQALSDAEASQLTGGSKAAVRPSRFQQLAFLNQPVVRSLPGFMARRWQALKETGAGRVAQATTKAGSAVQAAVGVGQSLAVGAADAVQAGSSIPGLALSQFPRPTGDTGRGIHWIPTTSQTPDVVDKYVQEAKEMGIKWVTFLNEGTKVGPNDYLVQRLVENDIEPVMRLYTDGGAPLEGDIGNLVRHYKQMGVRYFQLYNEPNLRLENQGASPDPKAFARKWLDAARKVVDAGGYPGFGSLSPTPGLAPGAAPGDMDDLAFLKESLQETLRLGGADVLGRSWLSVHNYGESHLRVRDYDRVVRDVLGRSMPQIGTEAGIYPGDTLSQQDAANIVAGAYNYLPQREDYYFAYTYWIIANDPGAGHRDGAWDHQALFRPNGEQSPLVSYLKDTVA